MFGNKLSSYSVTKITSESQLQLNWTYGHRQRKNSTIELYVKLLACGRCTSFTSFQQEKQYFLMWLC